MKSTAQGTLVAFVGAVALGSSALGQATDLLSVKAAAERGDARAEYRLGSAFQFGEGVPKDLSRAFYWTKRSAEHGYILGWLGVGMLYGSGQGVARDDAEAYKWFDLAARLTPDDWPAEVRQDAVQDRAVVAKRMTRAQIAEAEHRAEDWWTLAQRRSARSP